MQRVITGVLGVLSTRRARVKDCPVNSPRMANLAKLSMDAHLSDLACAAGGQSVDLGLATSASAYLAQNIGDTRA